MSAMKEGQHAATMAGSNRDVDSNLHKNKTPGSGDYAGADAVVEGGIDHSHFTRHGASGALKQLVPTEPNAAVRDGKYPQYCDRCGVKLGDGDGFTHCRPCNDYLDLEFGMLDEECDTPHLESERRES